MKKVLTLILALVLCTAAGCGKKKADDVQNGTDTAYTEQSGENNNENEDSVIYEPGEEIEKGSIGAVEENGEVKVTMPASVFAGKTKETANKIKENRGFSDVQINSDDSATFTMTKEQHEKWLAETAENIVSSAEELKKSFASVKETTFNEDFSEAYVRVDKGAFEKSNDKIMAEALANTMFTYQSCKGVAADSLGVTVIFVDEKTEETVDTLKF